MIKPESEANVSLSIFRDGEGAPSEERVRPFEINTLSLRSEHEYQLLQQVRTEAFTPWVKSLPPRFVVNALSAMLSRFFLEARERQSQRLAGFLFAAPIFWSGAPGELQTYDYHERSISQHKVMKVLSLYTANKALKRKMEARWMGQSNSYLLLALLVVPEFRSARVPSALLDGVRERCAEMGLSRILSPFRPSQYGAYKRDNQRAHSLELFQEYCSLVNEEGEPRDAWLRVLVNNGMCPLKIELRSVQIERPLREFEALRARFHPERWYQSAPNTWECGETATWYVDSYRQVALSVEPNLWGEL